MSALILQWRQPARPIALSWRGPGGQSLPAIVAAVQAGQIAALIGPRGADGSALGFVDYSDLDSGDALALPAGEWVRIERDLAPSANRSRLRGDAAGHEYWQDGKIIPIADGESFGLQFAFALISDVADGFLLIEVRPNGQRNLNQGPPPIRLLAEAGLVEGYWSASHDCNVTGQFAAHGAEVWVMHTRGGELLMISPEFNPRGFAGPQ